MDRPPVITLCGSTKFKSSFVRLNHDLTGLGYIILTVGWFGHSEARFPDRQQKAVLDVLHMLKIEASDIVVVIDKPVVLERVGSRTWVSCPDPEFDASLDIQIPYVGESTEREVAYALMKNKPVYLTSDKNWINSLNDRFGMANTLEFLEKLQNRKEER